MLGHFDIWDTSDLTLAVLRLNCDVRSSSSMMIMVKMIIANDDDHRKWWSLSRWRWSSTFLSIDDDHKCEHHHCDHEYDPLIKHKLVNQADPHDTSLSSFSCDLDENCVFTSLFSSENCDLLAQRCKWLSRVLHRSCTRTKTDNSVLR